MPTPLAFLLGIGTGGGCRRGDMLLATEDGLVRRWRLGGKRNYRRGVLDWRGWKRRLRAPETR